MAEAVQARDITRAVRVLFPHITMSTSTESPRHFAVRLPEAAYRHAGGVHELARYLTRHLGVTFGVDGLSWAARRDGGTTAVASLYIRGDR
jgi:hypothetical protein